LGAAAAGPAADRLVCRRQPVETKGYRRLAAIEPSMSPDALQVGQRPPDPAGAACDRASYL